MENSNADVKDDENEDKQKKLAELVLPKALEDVLALKDQRAAEFNESDFAFPNELNNANQDYGNDGGDESDDELENHLNGQPSIKAGKQSKAERNKRKKLRKKQNRKARQHRGEQQENERLDAINAEAFREIEENGVDENENESSETAKPKDKAKNGRTNDDDRDNEEKQSKNKSSVDDSEDDVTIEYVPEKITIADLAPMYRQFYRVFEIFKLENKPKPSEKDKESAADAKDGQALRKPNDKLMEDDDEDNEEVSKTFSFNRIQNEIYYISGGKGR